MYIIDCDCSMMVTDYLEVFGKCNISKCSRWSQPSWLAFRCAV